MAPPDRIIPTTATIDRSFMMRTTPSSSATEALSPSPAPTVSVAASPVSAAAVPPKLTKTYSEAGSDPIITGEPEPAVFDTPAVTAAPAATDESSAIMAMSQRQIQKLNDKYISDIDFHRKQCSKNKAILSFKYEELNFKTSIIQIIVIFLSTTVTFIESLKNQYHFNLQLINTMTIVLTTTVALIVSVYRYLKLDEKKENVKQALENHVFIINKFRKTYNQLENIERKQGSSKDWLKVINNYENEIFDNYIAIRENFDTIFSYRDSIYYKNKYKKQLLKLEMTNNEIDLINHFKKPKNGNPGANPRKYMVRRGWCIRNMLCCCTKTREVIDYEQFMSDAVALAIGDDPAIPEPGTRPAPELFAPIDDENKPIRPNYEETRKTMFRAECPMPVQPTPQRAIPVRFVPPRQSQQSQYSQQTKVQNDNEYIVMEPETPGNVAVTPPPPETHELDWAYEVESPGRPGVWQRQQSEEQAAIIESLERQLAARNQERDRLVSTLDEVEQAFASERERMRIEIERRDEMFRAEAACADNATTARQQEEHLRALKLQFEEQQAYYQSEQAKHRAMAADLESEVAALRRMNDTIRVELRQVASENAALRSQNAEPPVPTPAAAEHIVLDVDMNAGSINGEPDTGPDTGPDSETDTGLDSETDSDSDPNPNTV